MSPRSRNRLRLALLAGALALAGCSDEFLAGPLRYPSSPRLAAELEGKPKLQAAVVSNLDALFGPAPNRIHVIAGSGLPQAGAHLARYYQPAGGETTYHINGIEGGYGLYRRHCLHCHGTAGGGDGPTGEFLWPRPRDYRKGLFKFTSTRGPKPTRDDLRRTIRQGIANSSMPAFETLMSPKEIEQVIDYVIFLSARGETEGQLILEASFGEESAPEEVVNEEIARGIAQGVFDAWKIAGEDVLNPPIPRVAATDASIERGKELFLGLTTEKLQCAGCHGNHGEGNGPSFVAKHVFDAVVFGGKPIEDFDEDTQKLWAEGSLDEWGNPLRPANLNKGVYKGGRRPLDIYWRIAKGINGAKMPAHESALKPEQIWDLVNFVLALPYRPDLLEDVPATGPAGPSPAVARR